MIRAASLSSSNHYVAYSFHDSSNKHTQFLLNHLFPLNHRCPWRMPIVFLSFQKSKHPRMTWQKTRSMLRAAISDWVFCFRTEEYLKRKKTSSDNCSTFYVFFVFLFFFLNLIWLGFSAIYKYSWQKISRFTSSKWV